ncbi:MAG: VOC family protein [Gemmatimonadota bacterium]
MADGQVVPRHSARRASRGRSPHRIGTFQQITFFADDLEKTYQELRAKGVEFSQEPQTADWGTAAIFKDLDGNVFVLSSR